MPITVSYPGVYVQEAPSTPAEKALADAVFGNPSDPTPKLTIIRVEPGHEEPEGENHVTITRRPDGGFEFSGTIRTDAAGNMVGTKVSVAGIIHSDGPFSTAKTAEAAASKWAADLGAETLYVLASDQNAVTVGEGR